METNLVIFLIVRQMYFLFSRSPGRDGELKVYLAYKTEWINLVRIEREKRRYIFTLKSFSFLLLFLVKKIYVI